MSGMLKQRFLVLLTASVLLLLTLGIVDSFPDLNRRAASVVVVIVLAAVLLSAVYAVSVERRHFFRVGALAILTTAFHALRIALGEQVVVGVTTHCLGGATFLYVIVLMIKHLFVVRQVTFDTLCASVCVYLVIGMMWANAYDLLELLQEQPFSRGLRVATLDSTYYSLVTLSTLGYGDVAPLTPVAQMLCVVEAVAGQLYIAVLVARLVSLHLVRSEKDGGSAQESF